MTETTPAGEPIALHMIGSVQLYWLPGGDRYEGRCVDCPWRTGTAAVSLNDVERAAWEHTDSHETAPEPATPPLAADPAPARGTGTTCPQGAAEGERVDKAFALASEMAFEHYRSGRRAEGKALDEFRARLAELRTAAGEVRTDG